MASLEQLSQTCDEGGKTEVGFIVEDGGHHLEDEDWELAANINTYWTQLLRRAKNSDRPCPYVRIGGAMARLIN